MNWHRKLDLHAIALVFSVLLRSGGHTLSFEITLRMTPSLALMHVPSCRKQNNSNMYTHKSYFIEVLTYSMVMCENATSTKVCETGSAV